MNRGKKLRLSGVNLWRSQLSKQLLTRYILSLFAFVAALLALYFLAWLIFAGFSWNDSMLYFALKAIHAASPVWLTLTVIIGFVVITYRYLSKPLGYLDEVIRAAEELSRQDPEPVSLPPAMKSVQDELNLVRERSINSARAAREAEQRKNDMIVYLAHDLKTPLTSVIGYLTLLRDEPQISRELRDKYTGVALNKAQRLEELINEFFEITRFNLTNPTLSMETVNLSMLLEQICYEFNPVLGEKGLTWEQHIAKDVQIDCDPDKLERVFDNLIRNAVSYCYADTPIFISLEQHGDIAVIRLRNSGKTIPPEKLSRIFEQFFRLDSSRASSTGGSGLGLAIAKEIVELHGGGIKAESADDSIAFTVVLPLKKR